jgi:predicted negative regulator of RcsB-dependent stress response
VEIYNSEQEQVEALKAWWEKNGRTVIIAIIALLLGVFGWKSWQGQQQQKAESASTAYQQMIDASLANPEQAMEAGRAIVSDYAGTIYASMASMAMARIAVEQDDLDAAAAHLRAALEQGEQPELKLLARARLARVLLAQDKPAEALAQLQGVEAGALQGVYDELRGDILLAQGEREQARAAYTNALAAFSEVPDKGELVQLKLDDLAKSEKP